jgi:integrase
MAHIKKMEDKPRTVPWRAHVKRKGHRPIVKMFLTRSEAELWASEQERSIRMEGLPLTIDSLKKQTLGDIVRWYQREITPTKATKVGEDYFLKRFLKHPMCHQSLASFRTQEAGYVYIRERLKDQGKKGNLLTPRTVRREISALQHIFETAKVQKGLTNLFNPFRGLKIKGATAGRRSRRLLRGELERLIDACKDCVGQNRIYAPLAIFLAVETGMRLQEIFNLRWDDLDIDKRTVTIVKSKTDHVNEYAGRTIVLPFYAQVILARQLARLYEEDKFQVGPDRIFPMSKDAFKQTWIAIIRRAGIKGLTFHDLRREAASLLDEAGLTKGEHDLMMGHSNKDMASLYITADLKRIQDKLDKHLFAGMTYDERILGIMGLTHANMIGDPALASSRLSHARRALEREKLRGR